LNFIGVLLKKEGRRGKMEAEVGRLWFYGNEASIV